jgi:glucokinase
LVIGVDLGGTKIASALVDRTGKVVATRNAPTDVAAGKTAVLDRLASEINVIASEATGQILGVGIGSPGMVNAKAGTVTGAVNLQWDHVNLVSEMKQRLKGDYRVAIEKDANASVLGEMHFGAGRGSRDLIMLTIGTGFGAGIVTGGHLVTGAYSNASDLGHISITGEGFPCVCGAKGCVETVLSGSGLIAVTRDLYGKHPTTLPAESNTAQILTAARAGDALAVAVIDTQAKLLAQVFAMCVVMTDPERIILGGGLGEAAADLLLPRANEHYNKHFMASRKKPEMVPAQLKSSAVGAAAIALSE